MEYILFQILMYSCLICYIIYIKMRTMEYVGSEEKVGSHEEGQLRSSTHQVFLCALGSPNQLFWGYCISHNPYPIQCVHDPICQHAKFWTACTLSDTFNTLMFSFFCCAGISEKADRQKKSESKDLMMLMLLKSITTTAKPSQIDISMRLLSKQ